MFHAGKHVLESVGVGFLLNNDFVVACVGSFDFCMCICVGLVNSNVY